MREGSIMGERKDSGEKNIWEKETFRRRKHLGEENIWEGKHLGEGNIWGRTDSI